MRAGKEGVFCSCWKQRPRCSVVGLTQNGHSRWGSCCLLISYFPVYLPSDSSFRRILLAARHSYSNENL